MTEVISFDDAIAATEGEDRALLIGNGFSAPYFSYASLLSVADLDAESAIRRLFGILGTVDFEAVIRVLESAVLVERAHRRICTVIEYQKEAQKVREALVHAIRATHPAHRTDLASQYDSSAAFLSHFGTVFSLNYDLLLHWVNLEKRLMRDGFGLGEYRSGGRFLGPFQEGAFCELFNLHGGLHLFETPEGEVMKALDSGDGVVSTITDVIANNGAMPLYVAEGSSAQKMKKINSNMYLRYCYTMLRSNAAAIFVFGHSADENDDHIYRAIFESDARHLYFGVYEPDDATLRRMDGQLSRHQKIWGYNKPYSFYDSKSAKVWAA